MPNFAGMKQQNHLNERSSTGNFWFYLCYIIIPASIGGILGALLFQLTLR